MDEIYEEIYQKISNNNLLLPAMPEVGIKILSALNHPKGNAKMFAKIIENDMALSGFIIKTSRSLRFMTRMPAKNVERAVALIGKRETYHLSLAFLSRAVFHSPNPAIKKYIKEAYRFSTKMAVMAYFLADKVPEINPGDAMLAGLFQDIGVPAILGALEAYPVILQDDKARNGCIDYLAPRVGEVIMKKWGFNDQLSVVRNRKNWVLNNEQAGLPELILIARVHATIGTAEFKTCPPLFKIPAFHQFNLGELGPDNTLQLLIDSKQELAEMQSLLVA